MEVIIGMLVVVSILAVCSCNEDEYCCRDQSYELACVELSVAACMAAPDIPIRNLMTDERVGNAVFCDSRANATVKQLAADPAFGNYSLTREIDALITVSTAYQGTPMQPLSNFDCDKLFDHWYCVTDEGKVVGFLSVEPYSNIRLL